MKHIFKKIKTVDNHWVPFHLYRGGHQRVIIIAPGFFNSKDALLMKELASRLFDRFDVIVLDFRGHGQSRHLFLWTSKEYLDLLSLVEFAKESYKKIGVIGFSLGAATSLIAASKSSDIDSIVSVSGPSAFEKIEYYFWELNPKLDIQYSLMGEGRCGKGVRPGPFWLPKEKPKNVVKKIDQPVYYIHGTDDWLIKPWHSQLLYQQTRSFKKKLDIIQGAPHAEYMMKTHPAMMSKKIIDWFETTLI